MCYEMLLHILKEAEEEQVNCGEKEGKASVSHQMVQNALKRLSSQTSSHFERMEPNSSTYSGK